nr:TonB-dependent receptor [Chryseolinea sp.]
GFTGSSDNLEFSQRSVTNFLLNGEHSNKNRSFVVDWKLSPTISKIVEPDVRKTAFTYTSSDTVFSPGAAGYPSRIWRNLDEVNLVGKVDFTKKHLLFGRESVLKFGGSQVYKDRDFEILTYNMQFFGTIPDFDGDPENVMKDEYLYPDGSVYYSSGNANPNPKSFNSTINNTAFYVSEQFQPLKNLKAVIGLRAENYVQRYTGTDAQGGNALDNASVLDALDFFPSANFIYALTETQNLRLSYAKTIARPSFKELSFAQILDPVSNRTFNGGLFKYADWDGNLRETDIHNIDLRWELFVPGGEIFSLSAFYKTFANPIELVRIPEAQTTNEFQPRNVGDGTVLGVEVEVRKSLDFVSPNLKQLFISGNVTLVKSSIQMTDTEYNSRKGYEKAGEEVDDKREMAGQSPYSINLGLSYENADIGLDGGFFYNVNGPTLTVVGGGLFPDVYSEPFHSLNFNVNKQLGKEERASINFSISNILNDVKENFYVGYNAKDQYYSRFNPGTSISIGLRYNLQK